MCALQEFSFGGIVTAVRTGQSKNGNPFGIVKMEDFDGTGEVALFGKSWLEVHNLFVVGTPLFVRARMVARRYNDKIFDLQILSVELLNDIKETAIQKLTLNVPLDRIDDMFVEELADILAENPGNTELCFNIRGINNLHVNMVSRKFHIRMSKEITNFLNDHINDFEYSVN